MDALKVELKIKRIMVIEMRVLVLFSFLFSSYITSEYGLVKGVGTFFVSFIFAGLLAKQRAADRKRAEDYRKGK